MASDACAPQWYKKVAKNAQNKVKNRSQKAASKSSSLTKKVLSKASDKTTNSIKSSASSIKTSARRADSYGSKGVSYVKKGAVTAGKAVYKGATSEVGKAVGGIVKDEFESSDIGKVAKGLTGKAARKFYKDPIKGTKNAIKSGARKITSNPGKYAKQFVEGRLESTKVGSVYSGGKKAVKYGKKLANTKTGKAVRKKVTGAAKLAISGSTGRKINVKGDPSKLLKKFETEKGYKLLKMLAKKDKKYKKMLEEVEKRRRNR